MPLSELKILDHEGGDWEELMGGMGGFEPDLSPQVKVSHDPFSPDPFAAISGSTVSPSEILMNPPMSGSSTNLTSPYSNSFFDSPSEGYDTSPFFSTDEAQDSGEWYSLFPDAAPDTENSKDAPQDVVQKSPFTAPDASPCSTESPETSPIFRGVGQKRSATAGVRKRSAQLPPIVVDDPSDVVAMKRARNTLAARKSRAKKAEKMEEMQATIDELKSEVEYWRSLAETRV